MAVYHLLDKSNYLDDDELIEARRDVCGSCDKAKGRFCTQCGCVIRLKTKLKTEDCPLGKWPKPK